MSLTASFLAQRASLIAATAVAAAFFRHAAPAAGLWGNDLDSWPGAPLLSHWIRWDGYEWLSLAAGTAPPIDTAAVVVPSVYAQLVRVVSVLLPFPAAALLVSNAATLGAVHCVGSLARSDGGDEAARGAAWMFLTLPMAYLFVAANAESVFAFAAAGTFAARARGHTALSAAALFVGSLTHPAGAVLLSAPFLCQWLVRDRTLRELPWFILAAPVSILVLIVSGAAGAWVDAIQIRAMPLVRVGPDDRFSVESLLSVLSFLTSATCACVLLVRARLTLGLYALGCLALPWLSLASMGRASLMAFPTCLVLARVGLSPKLSALLLPCQVLAAVLFTLGLAAD